MNKFFASFAGVVAALAISGSTVAADWAPSGPIKMMIAFAAGGGADTQARLIAEELQKRHGWEIIPEQVTGGGGAKMAAALKGQPNDGTAIGLAITETFGYNMVANPSAGYTQADFTPLTTTAGFQMGVVSLSSGVKLRKKYAVRPAAAAANRNKKFGIPGTKPISNNTPATGTHARNKLT